MQENFSRSLNFTRKKSFCDIKMYEDEGKKREDFKVSMSRFFLILSLLYLMVSSIEGKRRTGRILIMPHRVRLQTVGANIQETRSKVCYDFVGCFAVPPAYLSFKRPPQHPNIIQTRFILYTRKDREDPKFLRYGDGLKSIKEAAFNNTKALKVLVHGYKGSGSDYGFVRGLNALLDLEDSNILVVDWTKGAATNYGLAVANTELVGRQLALILLDAFNLGTDWKNVHAIGFSLGAHVAGCASEMLKQKNILLGRITGLDPASPFFRNLRDKSRKLDASDAELVDIIHTDGSEDFVDGFGLLKPIGHVDFFPNGGKQQPGCNDVKNSVLVSHFNEELLDRNLACSHLRAWFLFVESILTQKGKCKFTAWPCPQGILSYSRGYCFPLNSAQWSQEMGYAANRGPLGVYFLPTRSEEPFCGVPLRLTVITANEAPRTAGILFFKMSQNNSTSTYQINCILPQIYNARTMFHKVIAVDFAMDLQLPTIKGSIWYKQAVEKEQQQNRTQKPISDTLMLSKVTLESRNGERWEYCSKNIAVAKLEIYVELQNTPCIIS